MLLIKLQRGEKSHGNSFQFRHAELHSSLCTVLDQDDSLSIQYKNALSASFDLNLEMTEYQTELYQNAMQYIKVLENDDHNSNTLDIENEIWIETAQRCSLIRGLYEVVAEGDTYEELALSAIANHRLDDIMINGINENSTWRLRLRQYGSSASETKLRQYGKKMRSPMSQEREVVYRLKELLIKLGGDVDLKDADVSLYVFEGLIDIDGKSNRKVLARLLTKGGGGKSGLAMTSIAPVKRLCVTTTPLAPIEAFTICNVARVRSGDRILDPFAGSCTTLLAASMLVSSCKSVGIEIAHNGNVNRQNIVEDFTTRKLELPSAIIHGDAMDERVRAEARAAVGNEAFDCIITGELKLAKRRLCFLYFLNLTKPHSNKDPPYGIREKKESCEEPPLVQLVKCIAQDRNNDKRLLKKGGRLVVFVPNEKDQDVTKGMPSEADLINAGKLTFCFLLIRPSFH